MKILKFSLCYFICSQLKNYIKYTVKTWLGDYKNSDQINFANQIFLWNCYFRIDNQGICTKATAKPGDENFISTSSEDVISTHNPQAYETVPFKLNQKETLDTLESVESPTPTNNEEDDESDEQEEDVPPTSGIYRTGKVHFNIIYTITLLIKMLTYS